jgi:hypothetical protein
MVRQVSCSPAAYHSSSAAHTQAALDEAQGDVVCGLHFMAGAVSLELLREQLFSHLTVSSQDLVGRGRRSTMSYMNNTGTAGKPFIPLPNHSVTVLWRGPPAPPPRSRPQRVQQAREAQALRDSLHTPGNYLRDCARIVAE